MSHRLCSQVEHVGASLLTCEFGLASRWASGDQRRLKDSRSFAPRPFFSGPEPYHTGGERDARHSEDNIETMVIITEMAVNRKRTVGQALGRSSGE